MNFDFCSESYRLSKERLGLMKRATTPELYRGDPGAESVRFDLTTVLALRYAAAARQHFLRSQDRLAAISHSNQEIASSAAGFLAMTDNRQSPQPRVRPATPLRGAAHKITG